MWQLNAPGHTPPTLYPPLGAGPPHRAAEGRHQLRHRGPLASPLAGGARCSSRHGWSGDFSVSCRLRPIYFKHVMFWRNHIFSRANGHPGVRSRLVVGRRAPGARPGPRGGASGANLRQRREREDLEREWVLQKDRPGGAPYGVVPGVGSKGGGGSEGRGRARGSMALPTSPSAAGRRSWTSRL